MNILLFPKQDYWEKELIEEETGCSETYLKLWKFIQSSKHFEDCYQYKPSSDSSEEKYYS